MTYLWPLVKHASDHKELLARHGKPLRTQPLHIVQPLCPTDGLPCIPLPLLQNPQAI